MYIVILYVELVSLKSFLNFLSNIYHKSFLTCLICFISTIFGNKSLNSVSVDVPQSNKQTDVEKSLISAVMGFVNDDCTKSIYAGAIILHHRVHKLKTKFSNPLTFVSVVCGLC